MHQILAIKAKLLIFAELGAVFIVVVGIAGYAGESRKRDLSTKWPMS